MRAQSAAYLAHAEKGGGRLSSLVPKKFGESVMR